MEASFSVKVTDTDCEVTAKIPIQKIKTYTILDLLDKVLKVNEKSETE